MTGGIITHLHLGIIMKDAVHDRYVRITLLVYFKPKLASIWSDVEFTASAFLRYTVFPRRVNDWINQVPANNYKLLVNAWNADKFVLTHIFCSLRNRRLRKSLQDFNSSNVPPMSQMPPSVVDKRTCN